MKYRRRLCKRVIPRWRIGTLNRYTFSRAMRNLVAVLRIYSIDDRCFSKCKNQGVEPNPNRSFINRFYAIFVEP